MRHSGKVGLALLLVCGLAGGCASSETPSETKGLSAGEAAGDASGATGVGGQDKAGESKRAEKTMTETRDPALAERLKAADNTFRSRKYAEALPLYEAVAKEAEAAGQRGIAMEAHAQHARAISLTSKDLDAGEAVLARAFEAGDDSLPLGWSRALGVRGIYERERGTKDKAKATFEAMYAYCSAKGLHSRAIDATHHLAILVPPAEQIPYALKGIKAAEEGGEATAGWLGPLWNNLGNTYHDLERWEEALEAFKKAEHYHDKTERPMAMMIADWAVGRALRMVGRLDEAEQTLTATEAWAKSLEAEDKGHTAKEFRAMCGHQLGLLDGTRGKPAAGLEKLKSARAVYVEIGYPDHWPEGMTIIDKEITALEKQARNPKAGQDSADQGSKPDQDSKTDQGQ